jgi:hypothetical protein
MPHPRTTRVGHPANLFGTSGAGERDVTRPPENGGHRCRAYGARNRYTPCTQG